MQGVDSISYRYKVLGKEFKSTRQRRRRKFRRETLTPAREERYTGAKVWFTEGRGPLIPALGPGLSQEVRKAEVKTLHIVSFDFSLTALRFKNSNSSIRCLMSCSLLDPETIDKNPINQQMSSSIEQETVEPPKNIHMFQGSSFRQKRVPLVGNRSSGKAYVCLFDSF